MGNGTNSTLRGDFGPCAFSSVEALAGLDRRHALCLQRFRDSGLPSTVHDVDYG
jgi:hypothetical protein